jgi:hypothetical protein
MEFTANKLTVRNGIASVPFAALAPDEFNAALVEMKATAIERGLWLPENAGKLVVAQEVNVPTLRDQLLNTVVEGATLFNKAIEVVNSNRPSTKHIPVTQPGEYRDIAEDWLNAGRLEAAAQLPEAANRPRLIVPRLSAEITREELVDCWQAAAGGRLWKWDGRMEFLKNWTANQLSGFDPELEGTNPLSILSTAYDIAREGKVSKQKDILKDLQRVNPELAVATMFDGVPLGFRYINKSRNWQDCYVRGINLDAVKVGRVDFVPRADVNGDGNADVDFSGVDCGGRATRLQVR